MSPEQAVALAVAGAYFGLYALTAGVEFGAGLLAALGRARRHAGAVRLAEAAVSPVWEVTNVFLILFALSLASFFPLALQVYGQTLLMPVATALLLLLVRYVTFGFRHAFGEASWPVYVHGLAGFLAPLPLMAFLPVSEGIGVALMPGGGLRLDGAALLASPFTVAVLVAAACSEVGLAGTLLAMYAARWRRAEEAAAFRRWGWWGVLAALAAAVGIWLTLRGANPGHAARLAGLWPLPAAVAALGALTLWALGRPGREPLAMAGLVLAYAAGLLAYALSHLPYLVEPELTVAAALNNGPMLAALIPVYLGGLAVALPLAGWVYLVVPLRVPPPA